MESQRGLMCPCFEIPTRHISEGFFHLNFDPSLTLFESAMFKTAGDQRGENKGNYHNPTRQRGIHGDTAKTLQLIPSLTSGVVMAANAQLQM